MSQERSTPDQAELTRRAFEAGGRHDLDRAMSPFAPEVVWDLSDLGIGTFEGLAAIRSFVEEWWATWAEHVVEVEETVDLGHGVVFASVREDGRLPGSDAHVEHRRGWIFLWVDDTAAERVMVYLQPDDARAAAKRLAASRA
jgi:ketosteroid isomerase-like protein